MDSIKQLISSLIADQRIRFLISGGVNTIVGYGTFAILIHIGVFYLIANIASTIAGMTSSYILNKFFTFKQMERSYSELVRFITVYITSFLLGNIILYLFVGIMKLNPYVIGIVNLIFTTLISWFGHKYYSFRNMDC